MFLCRTVEASAAPVIVRIMDGVLTAVAGSVWPSGSAMHLS